MCALLDTESNLNFTTKQHAMVYIKLNVVTRRMSYLDLGPPVPIGTLGDEVPPSVRVVGNHRGFFTVVGNAHHPKVLS